MLQQLQNRVSYPRLTTPAPNQEQLHAAYQAANRAPDHGMLQPWRFLEIQGEGRAALGELFVAAAPSIDGEAPNEARQKKLRSQPLRSPLIVVAVAKCTEHDKVPELEQVISAGIACHQFALALSAQGFASMWRTGAMAYSEVVHQGLGIGDNEKLIGFLYVGTAQGPAKLIKALALEQFVSHWPG